ncbi:toxin glutamine deamidase domain-containing protein [Streptomyces sp. AM6-12]|uniref:toxin glutamine deamidase domain-containing protein n=1 Tax=Streptomyces sp. AM6-12 TaxID=3345149 RepID=UPI0037B92612
MGTREEAVAAAERWLRTTAYPERAASVVMLPQTATWHPYAWTVCFDFREHLDTGVFAQAPFSSLVVVPHDGTGPHWSPTYLPAEQYLAQRAAGTWGVPEPDERRERAEAWLRSVYGGLVELAGPSPAPVYETASAWLLPCWTVPQPGFPDTPMLAASVVVPKDGGTPFHPSPSDPLADLEAPGAAARRADGGHLHARGCLVAVHCGIDGIPVSALPWRPFHEAPGWWERLRRRYFPGFEPVDVTGWDDMVGAVAEPGLGTRGVVWVRRQIEGHEISGNLIYVHNNQGRVVFLDGLSGSLARLDPPSLLRELVLLRR